MITKRDCLIALSAFVVGVGTFYFYPKTDTNLPIKVLNNCISGIEATNALVNNCSAAYSEVASCVANQTTCDIESSTSKLRQLNDDKRILEGRLKRVLQELDQFAEEKGSL